MSENIVIAGYPNELLGLSRFRTQLLNTRRVRDPDECSTESP